LGNLSTPNSVQKLQTVLHAKAKAEPGYRFYALYDKISREDILAHAYAQCRGTSMPGTGGRVDTVATKTVVLLTPEEIDEAARKPLEFRGPGLRL